MRAGDNIGAALDRFHDRELNKHLDATAEPEYKDCPACKGYGRVLRRALRSSSGTKRTYRECFTCNGTGKVENTNGEGKDV